MAFQTIERTIQAICGTDSLYKWGHGLELMLAVHGNDVQPCPAQSQGASGRVFTSPRLGTATKRIGTAPASNGGSQALYGTMPRTTSPGPMNDSDDRFEVRRSCASLNRRFEGL